MSSFEFHLLDKSFDRDSFDCGSVELNNFLKTKARQNQSAGANRTFVAVASGDNDKKVLGYYSLSMGEIELSSLPPDHLKKLPRHPVPVARMGRLAVDASTQGQGLGKLLLVHAMKQVQAASKHIGVYALLVDSKDDSAKNFYLKYGFTSLVDDSMTLFLPLASFPK
ncbi:MAG TPA: GNAT family N-acetyltransferase [Thermodesulfovibrionia bacterium]|nr:GNAT family N-acetyltransferase [Thermodesulfovibrionia bacterium]